MISRSISSLRQTGGRVHIPGSTELWSEPPHRYGNGFRERDRPDQYDHSGSARGHLDDRHYCRHQLTGTSVAVLLALGNNEFHVDPALTAATTVEFIAIGGNNKFYGGASTNIFYGDSGTNQLYGGSGPNLLCIRQRHARWWFREQLIRAHYCGHEHGHVLSVAAGTGPNTFDLSQQQSGVSLDFTATGFNSTI